MDDQGRYIFLLCTLAGTLCTIGNIYVPPPFCAESLNCLAQFMAPYPDIPVWVLGDFNHLLEKKLDKFSPPGRPSGSPGGATSFARLICELGLRDAGRDRYPDRKCYSCYSASHRALSRIDFYLCNPLAIPKVTLIEYAPQSIFDILSYGHWFPSRVFLGWDYGKSIPSGSNFSLPMIPCLEHLPPLLDAIGVLQLRVLSGTP